VLVKNHFNESIEVKSIRRKKIESKESFLIKVRVDDSQTEYWNYDNFMKYNPKWEWVDG